MTDLNCTTDSTVWVIGASSGIGRALVDALVAKGNFVICSARRKEKLCELASKYGQKVKPITLDVGDTQSFENAMAEMKSVTDYLDCIIFCAGVCEYEDNFTFDPASYERTFNTNTLGAIRALHFTKPLLEKSQHGPRFVAVGSLSSVVPFPRAEAYGASKAALEYFIKACHVDRKASKVAVSLVRPGFVSTPLTASNDFAMPFMQTVEQAASAIVRGIERKNLIIDFPKRLAWPLRCFHLFEGVWVRWVGPKLSRQG